MEKKKKKVDVKIQIPSEEWFVDRKKEIEKHTKILF